MNYFELYELPVSLSPDKNAVKRKFYELSRKYHPDFFGNADAADQAEALERSSMVNKAFKVFNNNDETIKYVLQLKGVLQEEEKYQLPPDFLMEMMEINEELTDAKSEKDPEKISKVQHTISNIQNEIYEPVKNDIEGYTEGVSTEEALLRVKEYYFKKKYLNRILEGLRD
jgi:molecular chaperone HscB